MYVKYDEFERAMSNAEEVFYTWDECTKEFANGARDIARRHSPKRAEWYTPIVIEINSAHVKLHERVSFVKNLRKQHEQLHQNIVKVMAQEEKSISIDSIE